jgi:hypothetical protein
VRAGSAQGGCTAASVSTSRQGGEYLLEKLCILGLAEVLQVAEIGHELGLVKVLLLGQVIEIDGIREALHKLGPC